MNVVTAEKVDNHAGDLEEEVDEAEEVPEIAADAKQGGASAAAKKKKKKNKKKPQSAIQNGESAAPSSTEQQVDAATKQLGGASLKDVATATNGKAELNSDHKNCENEDSGEENEAENKADASEGAKKKKKKKKSKAKVNGEVTGGSASIPGGVSQILPTGPTSAKKDIRLVQTEPPTIPVSQLFPDGRYPFGELQTYMTLQDGQRVSRGRENDMQKRVLDETQFEIYNDLRHAAEVSQHVERKCIFVISFNLYT